MSLKAVYGDDWIGQKDRYSAALDAFKATYGSGEIRIFRAPGRVNLIGEHTDYNHGYVLPVALDKDVLLLARQRSDRVVRLCNQDTDYSPISFEIGKYIPPGHPGDWGNYARGAVQRLTQQSGRDLQGFDGLVISESPYGVPRQVGLSSSSALTVVVAVALAYLNDWHPGGAELARICSEAEWYVGTRGGIMDQFAALLGRRDHALFLDCRPDAVGQYQTAHIPLPQSHRILVADSGVRHQNVRGEFNQRVAACRAGVKLLQARFPHITHLRDVQGQPWNELFPNFPEEMSVRELAERGVELDDVPGLTPETVLMIRARCRHVWTENRRVLAAVDALRDGDVAELGRLLIDAHASARDDYEVSCPELETLVETALEIDGVVGARLTGAGWGGCIVALVHNDAVPDFLAQVPERYKDRTGRKTDIFACRAGPGAGEFLL